MCRRNSVSGRISHWSYLEYGPCEKNLCELLQKKRRSTGVHVLCTLVIEPNRDPRMGRNEEGYSEDPYLCSLIAENIVKAMQGYDISGKENVVAAIYVFPRTK